MAEHDYKFMEYEDVIRKIEDVTKTVLKCKKGDNKMGAQELKEKLGDKLNMASLIINLTNVCLSAKCLMRKMHGHNFELRGKVADLSSSAMQKTTDEMRGNQNEIISAIEEVKKEVATNAGNRTFADILDNNAGVVGDSQSLVGPIKKAMRQVKTEDLRMRNVIVHGLDIKPGTPRENLAEHVKKMAHEVVSDINGDLGEQLYDEPEELAVLGKINMSGRAPPVLVRMKDSRHAKLVLSQAHKLSKMHQLRRVYITPDLDKEEREKRRELKDLMKKKITEFPQEHWVIRSGTVTSIGKHSPIDKSQLKEELREDKSLDRSFNY